VVTRIASRLAALCVLGRLPHALDQLFAELAHRIRLSATRRVAFL